MYRCPECRTRRRNVDLFTKHLRESGHKYCTCGGPAFEGGLSKHRPGTRYCIHHSMGAVHLAARYGASDEELLDIALEIVLENPGRAVAQCPF
jgi:hypothetical protein